MNEFQLIHYLTKQLNKKNKNIIKNIGDDAAVVSIKRDKCLLLTSDSLVENIHFKNYKISKKRFWYTLGWKSLAVNISDIYAMGGDPAFALVSLHVPETIHHKSLKIFYSGLNDCSCKYNVRIVGGNISKSNNDFIITVSLTGEVDKKHLLLRENAKAGDYIYVQKGVGLSCAGLFLLKQGYRKINNMLLSHLMPCPLINWKNIQKKYKINSAIDISDGLIGDLNHILTSSKKGADIFIENFSVEEELRRNFPDKFLEFILYGGEDYKILFTSPDKIKEKNIILIGRIIKKRGLTLVYKDKKIKLKNPKGFVHFR